MPPAVIGIIGAAAAVVGTATSVGLAIKNSMSTSDAASAAKNALAPGTNLAPAYAQTGVTSPASTPMNYTQLSNILQAGADAVKAAPPGTTPSQLATGVSQAISAASQGQGMPGYEAPKNTVMGPYGTPISSQAGGEAAYSAPGMPTASSQMASLLDENGMLKDQNIRHTLYNPSGEGFSLAKPTNDWAPYSELGMGHPVDYQTPTSKVEQAVAEFNYGNPLQIPGVEPGKTIYNDDGTRTYYDKEGKFLYQTNQKDELKIANAASAIPTSAGVVQQGYNDKSTAALTRGGPQAATFLTDFSNLQQYNDQDTSGYNNQQYASGLLKDALSGGTSLSQAQLQLQAGLDQNNRAAQSLAASARGGGNAQALANRAAIDQIGMNNQLSVNSAAQLRAQEMNNWLGQYSGLASQMRSGAQGAAGIASDIDKFSTNSQAQQAQFNANLALQQGAQNDSLAQYYAGLASHTADQDQTAKLTSAALASGNANLAAQLAQNQNQFNTNTALGIGKDIAGAVGSGVGAYAALNPGNTSAAAPAAAPVVPAPVTPPAASSASTTSDVSMKENLKPLGLDSNTKQSLSSLSTSSKNDPKSSEPSDMLDKIQPYSFNFKPLSGEDPNRIAYGVLAQDLEKTPMGNSIVKNENGVKKIDVPMGVGASLAALANLNQRLRKVEGRNS